jgi:hypothetical protein
VTLLRSAMGAAERTLDSIRANGTQQTGRPRDADPLPALRIGGL